MLPADGLLCITIILDDGIRNYWWIDQTSNTFFHGLVDKEKHFIPNVSNNAMPLKK